MFGHKQELKRFTNRLPVRCAAQCACSSAHSVTVHPQLRARGRNLAGLPCTAAHALTAHVATAVTVPSYLHRCCRYRSDDERQLAAFKHAQQHVSCNRVCLWHAAAPSSVPFCWQASRSLPGRAHLLITNAGACRYRSQEGISLPFKVLPIITEHGRTRVEANVTVKAAFSSKLFAASVVVLVPVPEYTAKANIQVTAGTAKYDATKKALVRAPPPACPCPRGKHGVPGSAQTAAQQQLQ